MMNPFFQSKERLCLLIQTIINFFHEQLSVFLSGVYVHHICTEYCLMDIFKDLYTVYFYYSTHVGTPGNNVMVGRHYNHQAKGEK